MKYGRYKVVSEIGRGSMGVVYKAHDPKIDRLVALKVLRQDKVSSENYVNRFLKEATAVGRLSHRSIVTVFDVGQDHGTIYIAMELLEGVPLDELIKQTTLGFERIVKIGTEVARALHYAHQKGIVHRDIKPANIICSEDEEVKVTDFGIAHIDDPDGQQMTQAGEILGTPVYMSPEQVLGQPVDGRSDIYSLGVILYELTTGQRPFKAGNLAALFKAITSDRVEEPVKLRPQVSSSFSAAVMRAMARDPSKRFSSGEKLAQQLTASVDNPEDVHSNTPGPGGPTKSWLVSVVFILLAVGVGVLYKFGYFSILSSGQDDLQIKTENQVENKQKETIHTPSNMLEGQIKTKEYISRTKEKKTILKNVAEETEDDTIFRQPAKNPDKTAIKTELPSSPTDRDKVKRPHDKAVDLTTFSNIKKTDDSQDGLEIFSQDGETSNLAPAISRDLPIKENSSDHAVQRKPRQKDVKQTNKERTEKQLEPSKKIVIASIPPVKKNVQKMTKLKMKSRPLGASIFIDGEFIGTTPYEFEVSALRHEIMLKLEGHGNWKAQLDLSKGGEMPLSIRLLPN